jgi:hypothetical protein
MAKIGWRSRALYILFALALIVGLMGGLTSMVYAQGSVDITGASPDKGFTANGQFTLGNVTFDYAGFTAAETCMVDVDLNGDGDYADTCNGNPETAYTSFMADGATGAGSQMLTNVTVCGARKVLDLCIQVRGQTSLLTADGCIEIGLDPWLAPTPRSPQVPLLRDAKGANQKMVILNLPYGPEEADLNACIADCVASGTDVALDREWCGEQCLRDSWLGAWEEFQIEDPQVVAWQLSPGLTVPGGDDAQVVAGGGPSYGEDPGPWPRQNWIEIDKHLQGEAYVSVWLDEDLDFDSDPPVLNGGDGNTTNDLDMQLYGEKKWGEIHHTLLDLRAATPAWNTVTETAIAGAQEGTCTDQEQARSGELGNPVQEEIADWVWAEFLQGGGLTFVSRAAHARVDWWVIVDDELGINEAYIQDIIMALDDDAVADCEGCGRYAEWAFGDLEPEAMIDDLAFDMYPGIDSPWTGLPQHAVLTEFKDPTTGEVDVLDPLYKILTHTQDSLPGETRGLTTAWLNNVGNEEVLVVTMVSYDEEYAGENPICVELGKKRFFEEEPPPPALVKTPQLRWAGEKIVLEQNLGESIVPGSEYIAVFHLESQSVGELSEAGDNRDKEMDAGDIWVQIGTFGDTVPECILESEVQGEADINLKLYSLSALSDPSDPYTWRLVGEPIVNYGFLVYFMAFEDIVLATDITPMSSLTELTPRSGPNPGDDAEVAFAVRGYFTSDELPGTTRVAEDVDGDGVYDLPEGRYVMPDDWPALANHNFDLRPNFDLMDMPGDGDFIVDDGADGLNDGAGPFNVAVRTTDPPGVAEEPSVGPFSTLQQWSEEQMWIAEAQANVPGSWDDYNFFRNTVVPDGVLSADDAPMPQGLVYFNVTGYTTVALPTLFTLDKSTLLGYGVQLDGDFPSPFYFVEIPSSPIIPSSDYDYNSWGALEPYEYWTDLQKQTLYGGELDEEPAVTNPLDLETYGDNHGIAGLSIAALTRDGTVTITATAEYPAALKKGKYGPITSDEVTISWGALDLNPHFLADKTVVEAEEFLTFTNETDGGALPYKKAQWDFNSDGIIDVTYELGVTDEAPMDDVVWSYGVAPDPAYPAGTYSADWGPGVYSVKLWMTDDAGTVRFEERPYYITVGGAVPSVTFEMPYGLDADPAAINLWLYPEDAVPVTLADVEDTIPGDVSVIWHYAGTAEGWQWFTPGWPESDLTTMEPGLYYMGIATTATEWEIPQV